IVPRRVSISSATLEAEPGPSIIVGLIAAFLLGPATGLVAVLLAISLIGLVLLPVLAVGVVLIWLYGLVSVSAWLGRKFYEAAHPHAANAALPVAIEVLMGMALILGTSFQPTLI